VSIGTYYPFIKLGLIWLGATGQCIKARKAAGDTIDLWDYLSCGVGALSSIEVNLVDLIAKQDYKTHEKAKV